MKSSTRPEKYIGIDKEINGSMTSIAKIIRDAWVFELIPETETCEGWELSRIEALHHRVNAEWDRYGCLVSHLPPELRERHARIHGEALARARATGWSGDMETEDES